MNGLQLIATGGALPGRTVTNEDLSRVVDTSDEWITTPHPALVHGGGERGHPGHRSRPAGAGTQRPGPGADRLLCLCDPLGPGRDPERGLSGTACTGPA